MTKHHYHAVIWIDHREARVFHFNPTDIEKLILHPDKPTHPSQSKLYRERTRIGGPRLSSRGR